MTSRENEPAIPIDQLKKAMEPILIAVIDKVTEKIASEKDGVTREQILEYAKHFLYAHPGA